MDRQPSSTPTRSNWAKATGLTDRERAIVHLIRQYVVEYLTHWGEEPSDEDIEEYLTGYPEKTRES